MKRKSICFTVPSANCRSGIVRVVVNLANALLATGRYELTVLALEPDGEDTLPLAEGIRLEVLDYQKNPAPGAVSKIDKYIKIVGALKRYFRQRPYDLCVISGKEYATFFWLACRKMGMPLVMWEHMHYQKGAPLKSEWMGMHIAMRYFSAIVCLTKKDEQEYLSHRHRAQIRQIYNITTYAETDVPYRTESRKLISVGYLNPIKGFDMLLKIAREVLTAHPDWTWDIYGEGSQRAALENTILEYGLTGKVNLKGYCEDLVRYYPEYAVFVMTSRKEGMPSVLLEAQKNHLPVVAFDIFCGPSDVIADGTNGYLIPAFDTEAMARRLCELMESPEMRGAFSNCACAKHAEYDRTYILQKWEQLIANFETKE